MVDAGLVAEQYSSGTLWPRLEEALAADGVDLDAVTVADLAPYDQFHGRGLEATVELADGVDIAATDHILDVGCGLGGPARVLAERFGCRVTGIDPTTEFCEVAERLGTLTGLNDRVSIHEASALDLPSEDGMFDGAYSMNVSMNISDREALYLELHRVIRPGGWLMFSEVAQGPNTTAIDFPVPWARAAEASFLITPDETCELLESCGFTVTASTDGTSANDEFRARVRALVDRGEKSPTRAVGLVHPDIAAAAMSNTANAFEARQLVQIEIHCTRGT